VKTYSGSCKQQSIIYKAEGKGKTLLKNRLQQAEKMILHGQGSRMNDTLTLKKIASGCIGSL
jgi:hypothetical protein